MLLPNRDEGAWRGMGRVGPSAFETARGEQIAIRLARPGEAVELLSQSSPPLNPGRRPASARPQPRYAFADTHRLVFVAEVGSRVVAVGHLVVRNDRCARVSVVVAPEYRHQGLGRAMLGALAAKARELGLSRVSVRLSPEQSELLGALARCSTHPQVRRKPSGGLVVDLPLH